VQIGGILLLRLLRLAVQSRNLVINSNKNDCSLIRKLNAKSHPRLADFRCLILRESLLPILLTCCYEQDIKEILRNFKSQSFGAGLPQSLVI
jgi:hypothetical protein